MLGIARSTVHTGGELLQTVKWVDAGTGGPPVHVHPSAEESYEVLEGRLDVFIDGRWQTLRAGEKAFVPPGTPHTLSGLLPKFVDGFGVTLRAEVEGSTALAVRAVGGGPGG